MRELQIITKYEFSPHAPRECWCLARGTKNDEYIIIRKWGGFTYNTVYDPNTFGEFINEHDLTLDNYYYEYGALSRQSAIELTNPYFDINITRVSMKVDPEGFKEASRDTKHTPLDTFVKYYRDCE